MAEIATYIRIVRHELENVKIILKIFLREKNLQTKLILHFKMSDAVNKLHHKISVVYAQNI